MIKNTKLRISIDNLSVLLYLSHGFYMGSKMRLVPVILCLMILSYSFGFSQNSGNSLGTGFEGKHFYVGFMQNEILGYQSALLQILITSSYPSNITLKYPGGNERNYSIKADSILKVDIHDSYEITEVERLIKKAVEIESDTPILVYAYNSKETTSDCFTVVPVSQWGNEYVVMSYPNDQYIESFKRYNGDSTYLIPRKSEFLVIAHEENTRINVIPNALTNSKRSQGKPFTVLMAKGDCYLVQSYDFQIGQGDLTGSIVRSDKPVGVISGHVRTSVPQFMDWVWESKDHLAVMLTPTSAWGRKYYSAPYGMHTGGDMFRVTNIYPNTVVTVETEDTLLNLNLPEPGDFYALPGLNQAAVWTANQPVQIGQYMMRIGGVEDHVYYDPCLVILPPAEQFVSKMIFQTVGSEPRNPNQYDGHEVLLVANSEAVNTLRLDGTPVMNLDLNFWNQRYPNSNHYWARVPIEEGKHHISCESGSFSGIAYGFGKADSYALTLGSSLSNPYSSDTIPPIITIEENCGHISGTLTEVVNENSSGLLFAVMTDLSKNYEYNAEQQIGENTTSITFTANPIDVLENGLFVFEYRDKNGNGGVYEFIYTGVGLEVPDSVDFRIVDKGDSVSIYNSLLSSGNRNVILDSVKLAEPVDSRFTFEAITTTPTVLANGERYEFFVSFEPDSSFKKLRQELYLYFDCDRIDTILFTGTVRFPELTVLGYDFGDVCLGETTFGSIKVVNNGNIDFTVDSITDVDPEKRFQLAFESSTLSMFPYQLNVSDTLEIPVTFTPDVKGQFERIVFAENSLSFTNEIRITGNGVAPEVLSLLVDWGKRRIGTTNDTLINIVNIGQCIAPIKFNGTDGNPVYFYKDEFEQIDRDIFANDSISIPTSYIPEETIDSRLQVFFEIDSPGHDYALIDLIGEGTIPVIEPFRIDFDTLKLGEYIDTTAYLIYNSGNEKLWLNYKESIGDDSSFIVNWDDYSFLSNTYLEEDDVLSSYLIFSPNRLGYHEMALIVEHDAFPNYQTGDTVVILTGFVLPADTISPSISFINDLQFVPCNDNIFEFSFTNDGNVPLKLDSLFFETIDLIADWEDEISFPTPLQIDSSIDLQIKLSPIAGKEGYIQFFTIFNDTIDFSSELIKIENISYPIEINNPGLLEYEIGDTSSLILSGSFPYGTIIPVDFELDISLERKYLYLLDNNSELVISNSSESFSLPMYFVQTADSLFGITLEDFTVSDSSSWRIKLNFLTLLSDSRTTELNVKINSDLCFLSGEIKLNPKFLGVCRFDIRGIEIRKNEHLEVEIVPNPVREELCIKINLKQEDVLNISIFDQNGKKIALSENLFLKKGLHSLIFEISLMASGIYMLSVETTSGVEKNMFIITK